MCIKRRVALGTVATLAALTVVAGIVGGCAAYNASGPVEPDLGALQSGCGSEHALVGTTATLSSNYHGVSGQVTVLDDCTLALEAFNYDGGGVDVRVIGAADGDFERGTILTQDIRRSGGYTQDTVTVPLPEGVTLDDVTAVSVWCLPFGLSFGDATLR